HNSFSEVPGFSACSISPIVACEAAMGEMEQALKPGTSENELWAELHRGNIARGAWRGSRRVI
ncbi:hypothetical protein EN750_35470, partial [Mesorhizobium sp. M7A.F.Ca.ET.027.03.2.1]